MRTYIYRIEDLSATRVRELMLFCLQYAEKKKKLRDIQYSIHTSRISGMYARGGDLRDPTANLATNYRMQQLAKDIEDIEQAAAQAAKLYYDGDVMTQCLLRHVTSKDKPPLDLLPCGRRQFYTMRRSFYALLDQRRNTEPLQ